MEHYVLVPHHGAGRGRLSRHGRAALFYVADQAAAAPLVGWCRLVGDRPAAAALTELQRLAVAPGITAVAAFVFDEHGVTALLHGGVPLYTAGADGRVAVPNQQGQPPTIVALGPVASLDVEAAMSPSDPLIELEQGVVAADGFTLRHVVIAPAPWGLGGADGEQAIAGADAESALTGDIAPAAAVLTATAPQPSGPAADMLMSLTGPTDDLARTETLAVAGGGRDGAGAPATTAAGPNAVRVQGLRCSRGHFNDPRARFCSVCGLAMHQASFVLSEDVRPPLGALVFSDGSQHELVDNLVFGRDPDDDPRVRSGAAVGVTLADPGNTISRVHAELRSVEWDVQLVDRGSTNGTFVWIPARQQWDRLAPDQPRTLEPGAQIAFGRLTATFESSLRPN